ncbi:hypothetical protein [Stenotrophomonas maltophilia]|uniref:hypothetical protein n=1 Tax=Stenotrophomonas maltophilia group TaxID=995085 RepID=UPI000F71382C|nr:hypothetical protein [Stenotrophomonas maltophilia]VEE51946.1 peptidase S8/S53 subtilisin kexin sedolisin [Stenotrophomonas maltophilia]
MRTSLWTSLASATTLVLASAPAPAYAHPTERAWTRGIASNEQYSSFIVKYGDGSSKRASATTAQDALNKGLGIQQRSKRSISAAPAEAVTHQRRMGGSADVVIADKALDLPEAQILMQRIADDPDVEYVQPNYMMSAFATPNDPRFGEQWHYSNPTSGARLPAAWDRTTG